MPSAPPFAKHRISRVFSRGFRALRGLALVSALALGACASDDSLSEVDRILAQEAKTAEANHEFNAAIHHYGMLYQSNRDNPEIAEALGRNQRYGGQAEDARRVLEDAVARLGPKPALLLEKGKAEIAAGRSESALETLRLAAQISPGSVEALATQAIALDRLGRYDEAAVQYRAADKLSPDNPDIYNNFALSRALAGEIDEAISVLKKAVALRSAPPRVRENLAFLEALKLQPPRPGRINVPVPSLKGPSPK